MAKFSVRFLAYLIDSIILGLILAFITLIIPTSANEKNLSNELDELQNKITTQEISLNEYINQAIDINYQMSKERAWYSIINIVFILIYFVIIPFYNDGATFGKRKCGIKVVSNDGNLTMNQLIIRNFIINGLLQLLLLMSLLYLLPNKQFFFAQIVISILQFVIMIVTIAYMLKRKDGKGLHDIITNTKVIEVEK